MPDPSESLRCAFVHRFSAIIATALLTTALAATPAVGLASTTSWHDMDWGGEHWDADKVGDRWDGGSAEQDGTMYDWPTETYTYGDDVCPDMDVAKTNTVGDPETLTLTAPEGKLVSAYCIKSGSASKDEGPKIVVLDEPVAELVIAYPAGGKCKAISHYAVAYVDAPAEPSPTPTPTEPAELGEPLVGEEPEKPALDDTTPDEILEEEQVEVVTTPSPTPSEAPETTDATETPETLQDEADPTDEEITAVAGDVPADGGSDSLEEAAGVQTLALTGSEATTLAIAAIVLVAVGVTALVLGRRRSS